jgi:hypothetical protein
VSEELPLATASVAVGHGLTWSCTGTPSPRWVLGRLYAVRSEWPHEVQSLPLGESLNREPSSQSGTPPVTAGTTSPHAHRSGGRFHVMPDEAAL